MKTGNAPARLLAQRRYSSGLFLPRPVLVDRSLSARHLSLRPKLRFHHLPALAKVRLCNGPSGVLDSLHPLSPPKDSCGKGREFQGSLPKIRKVVSDSTPRAEPAQTRSFYRAKGSPLGINVFTLRRFPKPSSPLRTRPGPSGSCPQRLDSKAKHRVYCAALPET